MRITPLLAVAGLLVIAGCHSKSDDETIPANDIVNEVPEDVPVETPVDNQSRPESNAADAATNKVAPPRISEEQQMQDDADATGMTSRLPEEDVSPPAPQKVEKAEATPHTEAAHGSGE